MLKRFFDTGWTLLGKVKYAVTLFGIGEIVIFNSYRIIIIIGIIYAILCFILGWIWLKFGFYRTEMEISNMFNPFVADVRKKLIGIPIKDTFK